jgi:hypothetical protein
MTSSTTSMVSSPLGSSIISPTLEEEDDDHDEISSLSSLGQFD